MKTVKVNEITAALMEELEHLKNGVTESINVAANKISKELLNDIREDSPVRTGQYKKGWTRKSQKNKYVIHNKNKPWLTHIAEFGYLKKDGTKRIGPPKSPKKVTGTSHIKKNEEMAIERYEELCVAIVCEGVRLK